MEELVDAVDPLRGRIPFERDLECNEEDVALEGPADFFDATTDSRCTSVLTRRRIGAIIKVEVSD